MKLVAIFFAITPFIGCGTDDGGSNPPPLSDSQQTSDTGVRKDSAQPLDSGSGKPDLFVCNFPKDWEVEWVCAETQIICTPSSIPINGKINFSPCFFCNDCPVVDSKGTLTCHTGKDDREITCKKNATAQ